MIQEATRPAAPPGVTAVSATPSAECLAPVRDLPGLSHACLLDAADGRVLAAVGADEGTVAAVLAWGRRAGTVATERGRALDDLIVTTDAAHHLLRAVGGPAQGPWVYLRVRREDGNLALARRQLAAVTTVAAAAAVTTAPARPALPAPTRPGDRPGTVPSPRRTASGPSTSDRPRASPPAASPAALVPTPAPPAAVPALPAPRTAGAVQRPHGPPGSPPSSAPQAPQSPQAAGAGWRTTVRDSAGVLGQRWRTDPETLRRVLAGLLGLGPGPKKAIAGHPEPTTPRSPGATPTRRNP